MSLHRRSHACPRSSVHEACVQRLAVHTERSGSYVLRVWWHLLGSHLIEVVVEVGVVKWTLDRRAVRCARVHLIRRSVVIGCLTLARKVVLHVSLRTEAILAVMEVGIPCVVEIQVQEFIVLNAGIAEVEAVRHIVLLATPTILIEAAVLHR